MAKRYKTKKVSFSKRTPKGWNDARKKYQQLRNNEKRARRKYHRNVDDAYEPIPNIRRILAHTGALRLIEPEINSLGLIISNSVTTKAIDKIKLVEKKLGKIAGANRIKSRLSKARRFMKRAKPKRTSAIKELEKALKYYVNEIAWRSSASRELSQGLAAYDVAIRDTIGLKTTRTSR